LKVNVINEWQFGEDLETQTGLLCEIFSLQDCSLRRLSWA
jgi:hypothetical protein